MGSRRKTITAVDLFCGAGGSSTGLRQACEALGLSLSLIAVNHWNIAIDTHSKNHPEAEHLCANLDTVDPRKLVPSGKLDLLIASPECTHHSRARGGKPINDQSRASAWRVVEWCSQIDVHQVLIENVPEFQSWGPLKQVKVERAIVLPAPTLPFDKWLAKVVRHGGTDGEWKRVYSALNQEGVTVTTKRKVRITVLVPIPERKGEIYIAFLKALESHGYSVESRVVNAADNGDATSRDRLFIRASKGRKRIQWPEATHEAPPKEREAAPSLFRSRKLRPYRTAREIIDWSIPGESIFRRKRPLVPATLARIYAGIEKICGIQFIGPLDCYQSFADDDQRHAEINRALRPFLVKYYGGQFAHSVDEPLPAITANYEHYGLCQPFIVELRNGKNANRIDTPLSTITTKGAHHGLCQPLIIAMEHGGHVRSIDRPLNTITTARGGAHALVRPFIIPVNHGKNDTRSHSVDQPMPTITSVDAWGLIQPFLVKYNGTGGPMSVEEPLDTVTSKDRFGLVSGEMKREGVTFLLDILFRMLQPHELAAAMSFPKTYHFVGNREQKVKQIGNAVAVRTAKALCQAILST